ncbi:MAG: HAD family acid phosphatase [Planctomycetota bacterium]|jgi:acid phosphatase (class B)
MRRTALLLALVAACAQRTVTVEGIAASLPPEPIAVGFDVDDTLLFSAPGFHYGLHNADGPGGANRYGDDPLRNPAFWNDMNAQFDRFSLPKQAARRLIALHRRRGDRIYFITARPATEGEHLSALLRRTFDVDASPVIFMGPRSKAIAIRSHGISLYYGDSDSDIQAAHEAGIRAIRLLRSPMSNHPRPPRPGAFGEEILADSEH